MEVNKKTEGRKITPRKGEKPARGVAVSEPLTDKEEWVCREFVADAGENQTRAYMRAFAGCNYESARVQASQLFAKVNIKKRVGELRIERNKRLEVSADKVIMELAKLAFYDPRDFFDDDGRVKPVSELEPDQAAVISGIETFHKVDGDEGDGVAITTKIKLPDKKSALELLGRTMKMFTDKIEVSGSIELAERLKTARERLNGK